MRTATAAALSAVLFGAAARADIVHYVNPAAGEPGHYDWRFEPVEGWQSWLDITLGSGQQTNTPGDAAVCQSASEWFDGYINVHTSGGAMVLAWWGGMSSVFLLAHGWPAEESPFEYIWSNEAWLNYPTLAGLRYIGVRTMSGRYGWIELADAPGPSLTAVAWACQTEPGVPILAGQVPAPGPAVFLGVGALGVLTRRRP
ncbi:MAG: hypothetical protein IT436_04070 [Phycisphaerales bacterium]|nr:hypothetical protein [Phycisphaerales bacterium]